MSSSEEVGEIWEGPTADYIAPRAPSTVLCDCKKSDDQPDPPVGVSQLAISCRANEDAYTRK
jgi:hypothetical protein